jgi:hypothetical protein
MIAHVRSLPSNLKRRGTVPDLQDPDSSATRLTRQLQHRAKPKGARNPIQS